MKRTALRRPLWLVILAGAIRNECDTMAAARARTPAGRAECRRPLVVDCSRSWCRRASFAIGLASQNAPNSDRRLGSPTRIPISDSDLGLGSRTRTRILVEVRVGVRVAVEGRGSGVGVGVKEA